MVLKNRLFTASSRYQMVSWKSRSRGTVSVGIVMIHSFLNRIVVPFGETLYQVAESYDLQFPGVILLRHSPVVSRPVGFELRGTERFRALTTLGENRDDKFGFGLVLERERCHCVCIQSGWSSKTSLSRFRLSSPPISRL